MHQHDGLNLPCQCIDNCDAHKVAASHCTMASAHALYSREGSPASVRWSVAPPSKHYRNCAGIDQPQVVNFGALFGTEQGMLKDPKREEAVQKCGVPFTIVRVGKIKNQPGADSNLHLTQSGEANGEIR